MKALYRNGLKGQQALSPGQHPGYRDEGKTRPERAKALHSPYWGGAAFAPTGRWLRTTSTQGVALGWGLFSLSGRLCGTC